MLRVVSGSRLLSPSCTIFRASDVLNLVVALCGCRECLRRMSSRKLSAHSKNHSNVEKTLYGRCLAVKVPSVMMHFESNAHHSNMHLPHTQDHVIGKQDDKRDKGQALELEVNVVGKQNDKRDELPGLAIELEVKDLKDDMKHLKKEIHDLIIAMATRPLCTPRRSTLPTSTPREFTPSSVNVAEALGTPRRGLHAAAATSLNGVEAPDTPVVACMLQPPLIRLRNSS